MKRLVALAFLLALSGCGCKPDPGDNTTSISAYWDGCWAAARRENR